MPFKNYRDESKINWGTTGESTREDLQFGCLLRIADATEKIASNYTALQNEVKFLKEQRDDLRRRRNHLERSNAALRGYIKRLKKGK